MKELHIRLLDKRCKSLLQYCTSVDQYGIQYIIDPTVPELPNLPAGLLKSKEAIVAGLKSCTPISIINARAINNVVTGLKLALNIPSEFNFEEETLKNNSIIINPKTPEKLGEFIYCFLYSLQDVETVSPRLFMTTLASALVPMDPENTLFMLTLVDKEESTEDENA